MGTPPARPRSCSIISNSANILATGYLTIRSEPIKHQLYELAYPNREVRESLLDGLLNIYREAVSPDSRALVFDLRQALQAGKVAGIIAAWRSTWWRR